MTSEQITRNHVLTELTAKELLDEANTLLRCPEREYTERGAKILEALYALGWGPCRECRDDVADFVMDGVELCSSCRSAELGSAWAGVVHELQRDMTPRARRQLQAFLEAVQRREADVDFALDFAFETYELAPSRPELGVGW